MKSECENQSGGAVASKDGLGINRVGDTILCYAWGETDRPDAFLAKSAADVKRFIVNEWIDDENDPTVKEVMEELAAHDWSEDGELKYEFEIGGVRFEDVVAVMPAGIDKLVDAFLSWPLPESVCSDQCACNRGYPHRSGTNLLTAVEARQMFEHLIAHGLMPNAEVSERGPLTDDKHQERNRASLD